MIGKFPKHDKALYADHHTKSCDKKFFHAPECKTV